MEETIEYLKKRIEFLELLLEVNSQTLSMSFDTNRKLMEHLSINHPEK